MRALDLPPGRLRTLAVIGAVLWIVNTIQYGAAQLVVAAAWHTHYSWTGNYISDLGNTQCGPFAVHGTPTYVCSPLHAVMNGSFVLSGVLTLVGTILLWRSWPPSRRTTVALVLWLVAGVLKVVVGLAPENTISGLHLLGAANLPLLSVAIVLLSSAIHRTRRGLAIFGLVVGSVGLAGAILSTAAQTAGSALDLGLGNGGMERLAGYPGNAWMTVVGLAVVSAASRSILGEWRGSTRGRPLLRSTGTGRSR
jgi:hypothetical membrane protein